LRAEIPKLKESAELVVVAGAGHSFEPIGAKRETFPEVRDVVLQWIKTRIGSEGARSAGR